MKSEEQVIIETQAAQNEMLIAQSQALKKILELLEEINYKLDRK